MARLWIGMAALALMALAGCEELSDKPGGKSEPNPVAKKSMENMGGMTGVAPPGGLE